MSGVLRCGLMVGCFLASACGGTTTEGKGVGTGASPGKVDGGAGTGGKTGAGGTTGAAGKSASGGASAGGTVGSGGAPSSGGTAGQGGTGGTDVDGGDVCGAKPMSKPDGRPKSVACKTSPLAMNWTDAGAQSCQKTSDCTHGACKDGFCGPDECVVDTDCPTGFTCACAADYYGGNALHGNHCIASKCRTDADCGPNEACSASYGGYCGSPTGFFCHSAADTCNSSMDCCPAASFCGYQPTLGHWACQHVMVCTG